MSDSSHEGRLSAAGVGGESDHDGLLLSAGVSEGDHASASVLLSKPEAFADLPGMSGGVAGDGTSQARVSARASSREAGDVACGAASSRRRPTWP